jgi:hypothetical protein
MLKDIPAEVLEYMTENYLPNDNDVRALSRTCVAMCRFVDQLPRWKKSPNKWPIRDETQRSTSQHAMPAPCDGGGPFCGLRDSPDKWPIRYETQCSKSRHAMPAPRDGGVPFCGLRDSHKLRVDAYVSMYCVRQKFDNTLVGMQKCKEKIDTLRARLLEPGANHRRETKSIVSRLARKQWVRCRHLELIDHARRVMLVFGYMTSREDAPFLYQVMDCVRYGEV